MTQESRSGGIRFTPAHIIEYWPLICIDLQERYGIDIDGVGDRSWLWLQQRIYALAATPETRLNRALDP